LGFGNHGFGNDIKCWTFGNSFCHYNIWACLVWFFERTREISGVIQYPISSQFLCSI